MFTIGPVGRGGGAGVSVCWHGNQVACRQAGTHARTHARTHTHTHTHTHTYTHTHTHTHTHLVQQCKHLEFYIPEDGREVNTCEIVHICISETQAHMYIYIDAHYIPYNMYVCTYPTHRHTYNHMHIRTYTLTSM